MGLKKERLWGLEGIKALGQRRGFGILVVNNRREDEIEEEDIFWNKEGWGCCSLLNRLILDATTLYKPKLIRLIIIIIIFWGDERKIS